MSQNEIIYADSVQFDIHKDSVFICILSENDNNFETRYGVLTPKLKKLYRILLNHNTRNNNGKHQYHYVVY